MELRESGHLSVSLVYEEEKGIIGHVAASPVHILNSVTGWFGLGPVSVSPEYQNLGFGSRLIVRALDVLRQGNADGCVVLGDPNFYHRFGFRHCEGLVFPMAPPQYFLSLPFGNTIPQGEVTYHESFYS